MTDQRVDPPAVTTRKFVLAAGDAWTDVGVGPLLMMSAHTVVYAISDAPPDLPTHEGFRMLGRTPTAITLASHVWATAAASGGAELYVAGRSA